MTAFARCESPGASGVISWELRTVNHRFFESSFRLPEEFRQLEGRCRDVAAGHLRRGRLDATLRYQPQDNAVDLQTDGELLGRLISTLHTIEDDLDNPARISAMDLLRWPGVLQSTSLQAEDEQGEVLALLAAALDELAANRQREGERIADVLRQRCEALMKQVALVRKRFPAVIEAQRTRLHTRLAELQAEPDQDRLEQEIVYLVQKQDVEEEMDRLELHLEEVLRVLDLDEPAGRRLDFLMQELNREANTLASKSLDQPLTQAAIEMKVLIEQMREQIQNVE